MDVCAFRKHSAVGVRVQGHDVNRSKLLSETKRERAIGPIDLTALVGPPTLWLYKAYGVVLWLMW